MNTPSPTVLLNLAERCEAAEGPSRALDAGMAAALGLMDGLSEHQKPDAYRPGVVVFYRVSDDERRVELWTDMDGRQMLQASREPAAYTASLDAAMQLVPEGMGWSIGFGVVPGAGDEPQLFMAVQDGPDMRVELGYATPALALCAAALRARAKHNAPNPSPET